MVRPRHIFAVFFLAGVQLCIVPARSPAWPTSLSDSLKNAAVDIEAKNFPKFDRTQFSDKVIKALAETPSGQANLIAITDVTLLGSPGTSSDLPRRIQVSRYEYATGLTWRTTIDVSTRAVVMYTADANRPTPLAEEEIERAIKIASDVVPDISQSHGKVNTVAIIQSSKTNPLYAHRLVRVWSEEAAPVRRALVDLSMNNVASKDY